MQQLDNSEFLDNYRAPFQFQKMVLKKPNVSINELEDNIICSNLQGQ